MAQAKLVLADLHKVFRSSGSEVTALQNINLVIEPGELICIVGSSGCGKSTMLRILAGLEQNYEGHVLLGDQDILGPGLDRGVVFQEHRLLPWLTVRENIAFGLKDRNSTEAEKLVCEHIELVGLKGFEDAYPRQLSGGMAQRAGIARALVNRPDILLLDEPFGALDALTKIQMQQEILRIWQAEGTTMILVTHDIEEAVYLADRVIVMSSRPGKIKKIIPVELSRPRDRNSYDFSLIRKKVYQEFFVDQEQKEDYVI